MSTEAVATDVGSFVGVGQTLMVEQTLSRDRTRHCQAALPGHGVQGGGSVLRPVDRRARLLNSEYQIHAKTIDKAIYKAGLRWGPGDPPLAEQQPSATSNDPPPSDYPLGQQNSASGATVTLSVVFGHLGNASHDTRKLAIFAGEGIAQRTWRDCGNQDFCDVTGGAAAVSLPRVGCDRAK